MAKEKPFFSVIIPVYKRIDDFKVTIDSVMSQSFSDYEVLVVDDCSGKDDAESIDRTVNGFKDERIKVFHLEKNLGGAGARNVAIENAKGCYMAFLDSDDIWLENKLQNDFNAISKSEGIDIVYSPIKNYVNGEEVGIVPSRGIRVGESIGDYLFANIKNGRGMQTSTLVVESGLAKKVKFNPALRGHQDWDLLLRLGATNPQVAYVPQCSTKRNVVVRDKNSSNVSRNLNYHFSESFYRNYESYMSWRARIYFRTRVLLPKSISQKKSVIKNVFYWGNFLDAKFIIMNMTKVLKNGK